MQRLPILGFLLALAVSWSATGIAQNPGSRIGTTPQVPLPPEPEATQLTKRCGDLRGEERNRCLQEAGSAAPSTTKPSGPEATGMATGAGAAGTAASGASVSGSSGPSAPR